VLFPLGSAFGLAILVVEQDFMTAFELALRGFVIETAVVRTRQFADAGPRLDDQPSLSWLVALERGVLD
jgi:ABC-type branched-subunit amino acid transport system ATPase component